MRYRSVDELGERSESVEIVDTDSSSDLEIDRSRLFFDCRFSSAVSRSRPLFALLVCSEGFS